MLKADKVPVKLIVILAVVFVLMVFTVLQSASGDYFDLDMALSNTNSAGTTDVAGSFCAQGGTYDVILEFNGNPKSDGILILSAPLINPDNTMGEIQKTAVFSADQNRAVLSFVNSNEYTNYTVTVRFFTEGQNASCIQSLHIKSQAPLWNDTSYLIILLCIAFLAIGFTFYKMKHYSNFKKLAVISLAAACLLASAPLLNDFILKGHDLAYHVSRVESLKTGLLHGQFPVRIDTENTNGFGYANSIFYPNLFLYIPALLRAAGVSMVYSYKTLLVLINIATAIIAYKCFSKLFKNREAGLVAAIIYVLAAYRLGDLYTRAALGETLAMTFLPLVLLGVYNLFRGDCKKWLAAAIGFTCLIQSHVLSTEMALLFSIVFAALSWRAFRQKERLVSMSKTLLVTLLLNIWFIVPFLDLQNNLVITGVKSDIYSYSSWLNQLFMVFFQTSSNTFSVPLQSVPLSNYVQLEMPLSIGLPLTLGFIGYLIGSVYRKKELLLTKEYRITRYTAFFGIIAVWMSTVLFPWQFLQQNDFLNQIISSLQFPWRFLSIATVLLTVPAAYFAAVIWKNSNWGKVILSAVLFAAVIQGFYFTDNFYNTGTVAFAKETPFATDIDYGGQYLYTDTDESKLIGNVLLVPSSPSIQLNGYTREWGKVSFDYTNANPGDKIEVPLYFYGGMSAQDQNGAELNVSPGNNHITLVELNQPGGHVTAYWKPKMLYRIADFISLGSIAALIVWICRKKSKDKKYSAQQLN